MYAHPLQLPFGVGHAPDCSHGDNGSVEFADQKFCTGAEVRGLDVSEVIVPGPIANIGVGLAETEKVEFPHDITIRWSIAADP